MRKIKKITLLVILSFFVFVSPALAGDKNDKEEDDTTTSNEPPIMSALK